MEIIRGTVFEIIFRNEDNGYTVALLETEDNMLTITGVFSSIIQGEAIEVHGNMTNHPRYGEQFKVEVYELVLPSTSEGIEKYLASGLIKGIGKATAQKIVEKFKEDTFKTIQYEPEKLCKIEGIGKKKAAVIAESFLEQIDLKEIMLFLQKYGISPSYGVKIYKSYGKDTINKVRSNPYQLTEDIYGIGFKLADKIAETMGIEQQSPFRISAGIKFILMEYASKGHSYVPKHSLINNACSLLHLQENIIQSEISNMAFQEKLYIDIINNESCVYYLPYFYAETNVCKKLIELACVDFDIDKEDIKNKISTIEKETQLILADNQKEAVYQAISNGVTVITGGPGTGKTTTINAIIKIYEILKKKIGLCAPTGRAAKRITETSGKEAKTIHRLLEYSYGEEENSLSFSKNEETPLDYDVIIIDEMSMVDILLMNSLLKAIVKGTRLILVGDTDQLPSVGAGNVLKDIIDSNIIKVVELNKIFRQAQESMIVVNAHKINKGEHPIFNIKDNDFYFMREKTNEKVLETIVGLCTNRLPSHYNLDPLKDIQVLSPMKKGTIGVIELNNKLQAVLNPPAKHKKEKKAGGYVFRTGDKIMQIKNNYQAKWTITHSDNTKEDGEGIYNGDIGYITFIDELEQQLWAEFDQNKEVVYNFNQLDELILAYAATVHKSQGSEFPAVIMPIAWGPPMLLTRNLLYTAITRAKHLVVLVGYEKYLSTMIENNRISKRYSALDLRLSSIKELYNIDNLNE